MAEGGRERKDDREFSRLNCLRAHGFRGLITASGSHMEGGIATFCTDRSNAEMIPCAGLVWMNEMLTIWRATTA
jgi:hypothetical protein